MGDVCLSCIVSTHLEDGEVRALERAVEDPSHEEGEDHGQIEEGGRGELAQPGAVISRVLPHQVQHPQHEVQGQRGHEDGGIYADAEQHQPPEALLVHRHHGGVGQGGSAGLDSQLEAVQEG
jgi:hypothetical protein